MYCRGGLELLFSGQRELQVRLPADSTIRDLIRVLATSHIQERRELFVKDDTV